MLCRLLLFYSADTEKALALWGRDSLSRGLVTHRAVATSDRQENPQSTPGLSITRQMVQTRWENHCPPDPRKQITAISERAGAALQRVTVALRALRHWPFQKAALQRQAAHHLIPLPLPAQAVGRDYWHERTSSVPQKSRTGRAYSIPSRLVVQKRGDTTASSTTKSSLSEISFLPSLYALS